jgi:hypothetical protein
MICATQTCSAGKFAEGLPFPQVIGREACSETSDCHTSRNFQKKWGGNGSEKALQESVFNIHPEQA